MIQYVLPCALCPTLLYVKLWSEIGKESGPNHALQLHNDWTDSAVPEWSLVKNALYHQSTAHQEQCVMLSPGAAPNHTKSTHSLADCPDEVTLSLDI